MTADTHEVNVNGWLVSVAQKKVTRIVNDWIPDLTESDRPRYQALADIIATDIRTGRLAAGDRLPPQRMLARQLAIDFTTVARGYVEAQKRGLIESRVGSGTFVRSGQLSLADGVTSRPAADLSMNLPPEPDDPALLERMQEGLREVGRDLIGLLRYQNCGGSTADKNAASAWLSRRGMVPSQDRVLVSPGAHAALLGVLGVLAKPGDTILSEALTYPGARSIAAQLGLKLVGLPMDGDGIIPDSLADACARLTPKALYVNPTLQNPTTVTVPEERRNQIAAIAQRYRLPIVEDDAYGFIPTHGPPPFAMLLPRLTWHVAGLSKCIGAGLRVAYVVVPDAQSAWPLAASLRTANVMASPITAALATRWISDGTADAVLRFIRIETTLRQGLAAEILPVQHFRADRLSFNMWVNLPAPWTRSAFVGQVQNTGVGIVASDAFTSLDPPPEAVRICLGGPISRERLRSVLGYMAHALTQAPEAASRFL